MTKGITINSCSTFLLLFVKSLHCVLFTAYGLKDEGLPFQEHTFFNGAHPGLCGLKQTFRRSPVRSNNRFSVVRSLVRYRQSSLTIMMDVIEAVQTVSV